MAIVLNGTTGITNDGGYTGDGIVFADTTPANTLVTTTGGNVGIGTSSPDSRIHAQRADDGTIATFRGTSNAQLLLGIASGNLVYDASNGNATHVFQGNGNERMRIDSSGNLLVGTTSSALATSGFSVQPTGNGVGGAFAACSAATSSASGITWAVFSNSLSQYQFYVNYAGTVLARSTSISGLSDQREKENIRPLETGLTEVMALQPRRFDWKNGAALNVAGFVAQEVEPVMPDLIDEYRINDEETRMALKMGDMIPTLVKAIQEQQSIITALTARVEALEGAQA
jgi:hypothetical protein